MKKISEAQLKVLKAFPKDFQLRSDPNWIIEGILAPWEMPKGTRIDTIEKLHKLGLIKIAETFLVRYPLSLTDEGKKMIAEQ